MYLTALGILLIGFGAVMLIRSRLKKRPVPQGEAPKVTEAKRAAESEPSWNDLARELRAVMKPYPGLIRGAIEVIWPFSGDQGIKESATVQQTLGTDAHASFMKAVGNLKGRQLTRKEFEVALAFFRQCREAARGLNAMADNLMSQPIPYGVDPPRALYEEFSEAYKKWRQKAVAVDEKVELAFEKDDERKGV